MRTTAAAMIMGALLNAGALAASAANFEESFMFPPGSAKPLTWWHWLNGTITRDGITADLEAMKRIGLGGTYLFNCGVGMPEGGVRLSRGLAGLAGAGQANGPADA